MSASPNRAALPPRPRILGPIVMGVAAAVVFFGAFGSWAALAPLSSAVLAPGTVIVESNRKTVQHLEGGIVSEILVVEGQVVRQGEPLIVLDSIQSISAREVLRVRYQTALAEKARLVAERDRAAEVDFPDEVSGGSDALLAIRQNQLALFSARRDAVASQTRILEQRTMQLQEQMTGFRDTIAAQERQLELIDAEIGDVSTLVAKGLGTKPRLLALQRSKAEIDGAIAQNKANIARAEQQIGETEMQIQDIEVRWLTDSATQLREVEEKMLDAQQRLKASDDIVTRTVIKAPVSGQVMALAVSTVGGVVRPGEPLLDIVPADAPMLVEARIHPTDIDSVHPGQIARVRLSAFSVRTTPLLSGTVVTVSGDALQDVKTGLAYFTGRVALDPGSLAVLSPDRSVQPGMPAEVMIEVHGRTFLDYALDPVVEVMERSFRED